jgi:hypothetical protein
MIHIDVKKVGRIPDGGGWRVHGRGTDQAKAVARAKKRGTRTGYVYLHSAIDGYSRLAYTEALPDEKAATAIAFLHRARTWFAAHGITRIGRIVTDNGACYRAEAFARALLGSRHQRITPYTPATTARWSATTGSSLRSSSTHAPGPQRPNAARPSRSGTSTTTITGRTARPTDSRQRHSYANASATSWPRTTSWLCVRAMPHGERRRDCGGGVCGEPRSCHQQVPSQGNDIEGTRPDRLRRRAGGRTTGIPPSSMSKVSDSARLDVSLTRGTVRVYPARFPISHDRP